MPELLIYMELNDIMFQINRAVFEVKGNEGQQTKGFKNVINNFH